MSTPLSRRGAPVPVAGRLPPGQHVAAGWPAMHYGRVPGFDAACWDLQVYGATATGRPVRWDWAGFAELPTADVHADLHCVSGSSVLDRRWTGVPAPVLVALAPPAAAVSHVVAWGEYGYSAALRLEDLLRPSTLLATSHDGRPLSPEHGFPLRLVLPHLYAWKGPKWLRAVEYLTGPRLGFWEQRGYSARADPWREQRYAHQDDPEDGPARRP